VDRLGEESCDVGGALDEEVFEIDNTAGIRVESAPPTGNVVEEVNSGSGSDVGAGPASLNPNFLNASTPSSTPGTSQLRVRVRWYTVAVANTAARRNNLYRRKRNMATNWFSSRLRCDGSAACGIVRFQRSFSKKVTLQPCVN
jgi:hypothetical protein